MKIRLNFQGGEDWRSPSRDCGGAQGAALSPAQAPAGEFRKFDQTGLREAGYGPEDFE
jgi:hypothetical protein